MRVLEGRFYPSRGGADFVVVAHLVWKDDAPAAAPRVRPAAASDVRAPMLEKLQFLVARAAPDAFARLQALKSQHWSFVEVAASAAFV